MFKFAFVDIADSGFGGGSSDDPDDVTYVDQSALQGFGGYDYDEYYDEDYDYDDDENEDDVEATEEVEADESVSTDRKVHNSVLDWLSPWSHWNILFSAEKHES